MHTIENALATNVIYPVLETFFKAQIRHIYAGQIATDEAGNVLPQTEFKSTWITPNKLLKDFYESMAKHLYSVVDPGKGCVIWIREGGTSREGDKKFTYFHYSVDVLGYDKISAPKYKSPIFSELEVFESLVEFHGIRFTRNAPEKELLETDFIIGWYGLTEFLTQARLGLDAMLDGKTGTVYLISHKTDCHDQPARNETRFKIAVDLQPRS